MIVTIYWVVSKSGRDSDNYLWVADSREAAWGDEMWPAKLAGSIRTLEKEMDAYPDDEFEEIFTGTIEDGVRFIKMREILE